MQIFDFLFMPITEGHRTFSLRLMKIKMSGLFFTLVKEPFNPICEFKFRTFASQRLSGVCADLNSWDEGGSGLGCSQCGQHCSFFFFFLNEGSTAFNIMG